MTVRAILWRLFGGYPRCRCWHPDCPRHVERKEAMTSETRERLEYLRGEIRAERISWGELAELQGLADEIDPHDVELLEWAGVPEDAETPA